MIYNKISWLNEFRKNKDYLIKVSNRYALFNEYEPEVSWVGYDGTVFESDCYGNCKEIEYGVGYTTWNDFLVTKDGSFELISEFDMDKKLAKEMQENDWINLKIIKSAGNWLIGLKNDGRVISIKRYQQKKAPIIFEELKKWNSITDITWCSKLSSTGEYKATYLFGLRKDGTVDFATDNINFKEFGQSVRSWNNVISITSLKNSETLVGLRKDGTVVTIGQDRYGQCNVELWQDIADVLCLYDCLIGVKKDGTLVKSGKIDIAIWDSLRQWKNIAIIGSWKYRDFDTDQNLISFYGITNEGKLFVLYPKRNPKIETNHGYSKTEKMGNYFIDKFIRTKILKEEEFYYQTIVIDVNVF